MDKRNDKEVGCCPYCGHGTAIAGEDLCQKCLADHQCSRCGGVNDEIARAGDQHCVCDYAESGLCNKCPGSEPMSEKEVLLGGCYHSGLAYALGYNANGEVELCGELFTNFDTGLNGNAIAALMDHRRQFNPDRDVKRFVVALKPVQILTGVPDGDDYKLLGNSECDSCGVDNRVEGNNLCSSCIVDDTCGHCDKRYDNCECEFCDNCDSYIEPGEPCPRCDDNEPDYDICGDCGEWAADCTCDDGDPIPSDEDEDTCGDCLRLIENCTCDDVDTCNELGDECPCWCGALVENCTCKEICDRDDELCEEFVIDRFKPMNAFARARWLKAQK